MERNNLPSLTDYLHWRFPTLHSKCYNKMAGRILHKLAWEYAKGNDNFEYNDVREYLKMKCPNAEEKNINNTATRIQLQFYQFKRWANKVDDISVAASRLAKIGDVYMFVKPDFITPKHVFEIKFYALHSPMPKKMAQCWEEGVIYAIAYPMPIYFIFITIDRYTTRKIKASIDEIQRIKNQVEKFYLYEWRKDE